jgi:hypothetical protein
MRPRFPFNYPFTLSAAKGLKIIGRIYFVVFLLPLFLLTFCKSAPKAKRPTAEGKPVSAAPNLAINQDPILHPSSIIIEEDPQLPEDLMRAAQPAAEAFPEMKASELSLLLPAKLIGKWSLSPKSLALSTEQIPLYFELFSNNRWQGQTPRLGNSRVEGDWKVGPNYLTLKSGQEDALNFVVLYVSDLYLVLRQVNAPDSAKVVYARK